MSLDFIKGTRIRLKDHDFDETWLRDLIAGDPSILDLGSLSLAAVERPQPGAGRLDLLLQNSHRRYVVELMLGRMDESHIIRCIEYWDLEKKRCPRYEHYAVLVAEEMTSRFLNVLSLVARVVPLIALQVTAIKMGNRVALTFAKVLDEVTAGSGNDPHDGLDGRAFWERKSSPVAMRLLDESLAIVREIDPRFAPLYRKSHITVSRGLHARRFVVFRPSRHWLRVEVRLADAARFCASHPGAEAALPDLDRRHSYLRFVLAEGQVLPRRRLLKRLFLWAHHDLLGTASPIAEQLPIWAGSRRNAGLV